ETAAALHRFWAMHASPWMRHLPAVERRLVGRDSETGLLAAALQTALAGHGRIVEVVSASGSRQEPPVLRVHRALRQQHRAHGKTVGRLPVLWTRRVKRGEGGLWVTSTFG
ncbi:MAG TPA: hypothetical protein VN812_10315, partial [Candidatus Acidoferrales bacterium]|nr:hypothetical protein [Candidatus Acidoferrales bacterium]